MLYFSQHWALQIPSEVNFTCENIIQDVLCMQKMNTYALDLTVFDYLIAIFGYIVWQLLYLIKTEVWDKDKLDRNPELLTSLRWISTDLKNPLARLILKYLKMLGVFKKDEDYDPKTIKTKLVFVFSQLLYTIATFLPTSLCFYSKGFHLLYIASVFTVAVFNAASFYIEIFSKRYNLRIQEIEEMHQVAKNADKVVKRILSLHDIQVVHHETNESVDTFTETITTDLPTESNDTVEEEMKLKKISEDLNNSTQSLWRILLERSNQLSVDAGEGRFNYQEGFQSYYNDDPVDMMDESRNSLQSSNEESSSWEGLPNHRQEVNSMDGSEHRRERLTNADFLWIGGNAIIDDVDSKD